MPIDGRANIYRALTARLNDLGQDRTDIQFAVKELSRKMSCPNEADCGKRKKVLRDLTGKPRFRM